MSLELQNLHREYLSWKNKYLQLKNFQYGGDGKDFELYYYGKVQPGFKYDKPKKVSDGTDVQVNITGIIYDGSLKDFKEDVKHERIANYIGVATRDTYDNFRRDFLSFFTSERIDRTLETKLRTGETKSINLKIENGNFRSLTSDIPGFGIQKIIKLTFSKKEKSTTGENPTAEERNPEEPTT